jgi:hypothetical protein
MSLFNTLLCSLAEKSKAQPKDKQQATRKSTNQTSTTQSQISSAHPVIDESQKSTQVCLKLNKKIH